MGVNEQALKLSADLAQELGSSYLKIGDLVIDEETAEIIEFPENLEGAADRLEWLGWQMKDALEQEKQWKNVKRFRQAVMKKLMDQMELDYLKVSYGTIRWRGGNRTADINRLPQVQVNYELSNEDIDTIILQCAGSLKPDRVELLMQARPDLRDALIALMDVTEGWVAVDMARKRAPEIEQVPRGN